MKMPLPTKTASAPSCMTRLASAGVAMPPAEKFGTGSFPAFATMLDQFVGGAVLFGFGVEFFFAEHREDLHFLNNLADVLDGVDYVAGAGFALGADHGGAFGDAAEGFAEVAGAADEGDLEGVLVDVVGFVGGGEDFGFVDVVDAEFLREFGLRQNVRCGTWP